MLIFKIYLILLFVNIIINKPKKNTLYCGIFGWSGKSTKDFSELKFRVLGIDNEYRGTDSCGIYFDMDTIYGVGTRSKFSKFITDNTRIRPSRFNTVLGHTRNASVGIVNEKNAQPLINFIEKDKSSRYLDFVITHNGTLYNYEELAKKYKIETNNYTDSFILGKLICKAGWDVLTEYKGSASLAFIDGIDANSIYLYHGKSKYNETGNYTTEERPLYYLRQAEGIYYSSIERSLDFINMDSRYKVKELPHNKLFKLNNGNIEEVGTYDRSDCVHGKSYSNKNYYSNSNSYPKPKSFNKPITNSSSPSTILKSNRITFSARNIDAIEEDKLLKDSRYINFCKGRYYLDSSLAEGSYIIDKYGRIMQSKYAAETHYCKCGEYSFIEGYLMKSADDYANAWIEISKKPNLTDREKVSNVFRKRARQPIAIPNSSHGTLGYIKENKVNNIFHWFEGTFEPYFSNKKYRVTQGDCREFWTGTWKCPPELEGQVDRSTTKDTTTASFTIVKDREEVTTALNKFMYKDIFEEGVYCDDCGWWVSSPLELETSDELAYTNGVCPNCGSLNLIENYNDEQGHNDVIVGDTLTRNGNNFAVLVSNEKGLRLVDEEGYEFNITWEAFNIQNYTIIVSSREEKVNAETDLSVPSMVMCKACGNVWSDYPDSSISCEHCKSKEVGKVPKDVTIATCTMCGECWNSLSDEDEMCPGCSSMSIDYSTIEGELVQKTPTMGTFDQHLAERDLAEIAANLIIEVDESQKELKQHLPMKEAKILDNKLKEIKIELENYSTPF